MRKIDWGRLNPRFWHRLYPTDWEWDAILNDLLDKHGVIVKSYEVVKVGPIEVWVAGYPYAYGTCWKPCVDVLPTTATQKRLKRMVDAARPSRVQKIRDVIANSEGEK